MSPRRDPYRPHGGLVPPVALRVGGLTAVPLAGDAVAWAEARATDGEGGADIGLGLLVFAVVALVALAWSTRDGAASARRGEPADRWVLCWAAVAVLFGVLSAVLISVLGVLSALAGGDFSAGDLVHVLPVLAVDLSGVTPFSTLLVGGPALAGLAVGRVVQGRRPVDDPCP